MSDSESSRLLSSDDSQARYSAYADQPPARLVNLGSPDLDERSTAVNDDDDGSAAAARNKYWLRLRYYIPVLAWLPKYTLQTLLYDFVAGTSVAFLIIPQGLSYASLARMPPIFGLYGAFLPLVIYALLGTSRQLSIGPEAIVSLLVGTATSIEGLDDEQRYQYVAVLSTLVGAITLVMGILRLGFLDSIFSKATNRGFITGVAFVVMTEQLPKVLGIEEDKEGSHTPIVKLIHILTHFGEAQWLPAVFAIVGFLFLLAMDFVKRRYPKVMAIKLIPAIMIVVVVSILLSWGLKLDETGGLAILGDVDSGFVTPFWPEFSAENTTVLLPNAVVIVIVGFVESIIVGKLYASKHNYALSDNRELVAIGAANLFSSFFGVYPAFGSMPRTRMNDGAGAKTQMAGFITSLYAMFTILFLMFLFYYLPMAILGTIVLFAAYSLLELHDFVFFYKIKAWKDLFIAVACVLVTYCAGVEFGVIFLLVVSIGLVIKNVTRDVFAVLGYSPEADDFLPISSRNPDAKPLQGLIAMEILDSLFFGNTGTIKERLRRIELFGSLSVHPGSDESGVALTAVVVDFERMHDIDPSALFIILELFEEYQRRGISVAIARLHKHLHPLFELAGIMKLVKDSQSFSDVKAAVAALNLPTKQ